MGLPAPRPPDTPLLSIAIPTYNRPELLLETVECLLGQEFKDFEVIIGNDYVEQELTLDRLGVSDGRVRVVNREVNLGELDNMNRLLEEACGQYFTWQFDDDPCAPQFLDAVSRAIVEYEFPDCVFTSFETIFGERVRRSRMELPVTPQCYTGREFLTRYLKNDLQALGCCGFYRLDYLRALGGVARLSGGKMALFSEFLLVVQQGLARKVVHIDKPLVVTRHHSGSWTYTNDSYEQFREAGLNYIRESISVLSDPRLVEDFEDNLLVIMNSVISAVAVKAWNRRWVSAFEDMREYVVEIARECREVQDDGLRRCSESVLGRASRNYWLSFVKAACKKSVPMWVLSFIQRHVTSVRRLSRRNF